jgi:hypothetical protein
MVLNREAIDMAVVQLIPCLRESEISNTAERKFLANPLRLGRIDELDITLVFLLTML